MRRLPGDPPETQDTQGMLRVDHAGEYGAMRIYAGQLAVLKDKKARGLIEEMAAQEKKHLAAFEHLMRERQVRPTVLMPLWHVAGYALGAVTALMGEKAAFACTVAVESVIGDHYAAQQQRLGADEAALVETIEAFRKDEMEHHDTSLSEGAEQVPFYPVLSAGIKLASRLAIWLSTRV